MHPGVDLIVCNYRTPDDLCRFIQSYETHKPDIHHQLFIANVDPQTADFEIGEHYSDADNIHHVTFNTNVGYAGAINSAALLGTHEILAAFNADTMLTAGAIDKCVATLKSRDDWAILGPLQTNDQGLITHAGIFGTADKPYLRGWQQPVANQYRELRDDAISVSGSAYFVKRKVWWELRDCDIFQTEFPETVGAFLPTPHYYDETWCSYHAKAHGYKIVYQGEIEMIHNWHRASPVGGFAEQVMPESRRLFRAACKAHGIPCD